MWMRILRRAGFWGSTGSDTKFSASQMLKKLKDSMEYEDHECEALRNCPLRVRFNELVSKGNRSVLEASVTE